MTPRPTPETDALTALHAASGIDNMTLQYVDMRAIARKFERQRDEAVELLRELLDSHGQRRLTNWKRARAFLARLEKERQA